MKIIDIAFKDMLRYFRSSFAVGMMLVAPIFITGLIYFAFSSVFQSSETAAYTLPVIKIQVVNLDQGVAGQNAGKLLEDMLSSDEVKDVFAVTRAASEADARAAVDHQQAALALIIPANFSQAAFSGTGQAAVEMYQDPTLSFGPGITREVLSQFLDVLSGGQIAVNVIGEQLSERGRTLDPAAVQKAQVDYANWFQSVAGEKEWQLPVIQRVPNKETPKSIGDHRTTLMGPVMAGMLIFFVFFTGANTAQSILREQEEGTLARLFTTPTSFVTILGGKFLAVFMTLIVQAVVLIAVSGWLFGIDWGQPGTLVLVLIGLVVAAAGMGIFLVSLTKSTRQAGVMIGGALTITSMVGGLFSTGLSQVPPLLNQISLTMPQGWALQGIKVTLAGSGPQQALIPVLGMLIFGGILFAFGTRRFSVRFA